MKLNYKNGFTLIELLIVIVIIGILAGVVLAVINPQRMIQRSQHATLRGSVSKVCMALYACAGSTTALASCNTAANLGIVATIPDSRVNVTYASGAGTTITVTGTETNGSCTYSCSASFASGGWTTTAITRGANCID